MTTSPTQVCEDILRADIKYNVEHRIWPSVVAVAERLLARRAELTDAYAELVEKLGNRPQALKVFFDVLLGAAALRHPEATARSRQDRAELEQVNSQIATKALELSSLLERRSDIHNTTDFHSDTHYSVCGVIEAAARDVPLFDGWVKEPLQTLSARFDLKYWPSIAAFVREISQDAAQATPLAMDQAAAAATMGKRASPTDFFGYLYEGLEDAMASNGGFIPKGFKVSDRSMASLATCALGRDADEPFDAPYVKQVRQRLRQRDGAADVE